MAVVKQRSPIQKLTAGLESTGLNPNEAPTSITPNVPKQNSSTTTTTTTTGIQPQVPNIPIINANSLNYTPPQTSMPGVPSTPAPETMKTRLQTGLDARKAEADRLSSQGDLVSERINELAGLNTGRKEYRDAALKDAGIEGMNKYVDDLSSLIQQKTSKYENDNIQDKVDFEALAGTGQGIPLSLVRGRQARLQTQRALERQSDAAEINSLNRTLELAQGRVATAQANIDKDLDLEFKDRETALNNEYKMLERLDTKTAEARREKLSFELQDVQNEREDRKSVMQMAVDLAKNGAPPGVIQAANSAKDILDILSIPGADKYFLSQEDKLNIAIKQQALSDARRAASNASGDNQKVVSEMEKNPDFKKLKGAKDLEYALTNYENAVETAGGAKRKGRAGAQPIESAYQEVLQAYRAAKDLGVLQGGDIQLVESAVKEATYGKGTQYRSLVPGLGKGQATRAAESSISSAKSIISKNADRQAELLAVAHPAYADTTYYNYVINPGSLGEVATDIESAGDASVFSAINNAAVEDIANDDYASGIQ